MLLLCGGTIDHNLCNYAYEIDRSGDVCDDQSLLRAYYLFFACRQCPREDWSSTVCINHCQNEKYREIFDEQIFTVLVLREKGSFLFVKRNSK